MEIARREKKIINIFFVFCIAAAFACFALVVLPEQLKKNRVAPPAFATAPKNISAIVPLDSPAEQGPLIPAANVALFAPDTPPAGPNAMMPRETGLENDPAGGAGAAIDDTSSEARQASAYASEKTTDSNLAAGAEGETLPEPQNADNLKPLAPPASGEYKQYPFSTIARHEPSALDNPKLLEKKSWLATPAELSSEVAFWKDIYSKYDRNQSVLHHPRHLNIVYDVLDLTDIDKDPRLTDIEKRHLREKRVENRKKEVTEALLKLSEGPQGSSLTDDELQIKKLFQGLDEPDKYKNAALADGVRSQTGLKDKFILGLKYSGKYLGEIEAIFESYGLPRELTRIIFVESMFNTHAVSSVGASGIWQFMRGTGKLYMRVGDLVDERNDPIAATHAAAKLLRSNYDYLGSWPLAINAYNTGRGRMQQAVAALGTSDIGRIIKNFDHPAYGFASRNFFLEFLAALDVAEHAEKYFGPIEFDKPLRYEIVRTNYNISLPEVSKIAGISAEDILELNPAFSERVAEGARLVPAKYAVRVPEKKSELFLAAAIRAPKSKTGPVNHIVENGETLVSISEMYGVPQQSIIKSNNLVGRRVRPGQVLTVPVGNRQ